MYYVYGIIDPTENMIGYVGITNNTPQRRLVQHLRADERDSKGPKRKWLDGLLENGFMPTVITLQTANTVQQAQVAERWWIAHGQMIGWPLRNSMHLVRQALTEDTEDGGALYSLDSESTSRADANSLFPLCQLRELTPIEASEVQRMVASGMSRNAIIRIVFGDKNGPRADIIRRAIEGSAA